MFVFSICLCVCVLDTWTWARFCSSVAWMRTFPTFTLSSSTNTSLAAFATWWWTARWRTHTQIQARTHPPTPHTHTCTPADKWFNKSRERSQFPGAVLEMLTVTSKHFETECTVTCTVMLKFLPCCWDTAAHPDFKASPPPLHPSRTQRWRKQKKIQINSVGNTSLTHRDMKRHFPLKLQSKSAVHEG